jgi:hypothetical protein
VLCGQVEPPGSLGNVGDQQQGVDKGDLVAGILRRLTPPEQPGQKQLLDDRRPLCRAGT